MALSKSDLKDALEAAFITIFEDIPDNPPKTAAEKADDMAQAVSDTVDTYVRTAIAGVTISSGTVITAVTGGSGAPAVGIPNPAPIPLSGDPDLGTGGLS